MPSRIMILIASITFVVLLGVGIVVPILPAYATDLGATATQIGLIFSGFSLSRTLVTPIAGIIADRSEIKRLMLLGLFLYTGIAILYVWAQTPISLIWIRILHGFASAFILPLAMSYVAIIAEEGKEGLYMGTFNMSLFLGMGMGPLLGGVITDAFGINATFYCLSVLSCISGIIALLLLPQQRTIPEGSISARKWHPSMYSPMAGLLLFRILAALGRGCLLAFVPLLALASGLNMMEIGILISSNIFITGLLQRPFGRIVNRKNMVPLIITGALISAGALAALPLGWSFTSFFLIGSILGMGGALSIPASSVMAMEHGKSLGMATAMSAFEAARGVGMILGPVLSGIIMDFLGINSVFYAGGTCIALGTAVFFVLIRRRPS